MNPALAAAIAGHLDAPLTDLRSRGQGFTRNWHARAGARPLFIKLSDDGDRLQAEADGLQALAGCAALRVPQVLARGTAAETSFLVLEWLDLSPRGEAARLGAALAALHRHRGPDYGWHRDNYLGASLQANERHSDWCTFFTRQRLTPQLERALGQGYRPLAGPGRRVLEAVPHLLADHQPPPALLHGDLWHGNVAYVDGQPCCFDPAVHFGDAECDLALAALFGGFPAAFFAAHGAEHPLPPGWQARRRLYQLYHLLNHLNLFGDPYLGATLATLEALA